MAYSPEKSFVFFKKIFHYLVIDVFKPNDNLGREPFLFKIISCAFFSFCLYSSSIRRFSSSRLRCFSSIDRRSSAYKAKGISIKLYKTQITQYTHTGLLLTPTGLLSTPISSRISYLYQTRDETG